MRTVRDAQIDPEPSGLRAAPANGVMAAAQASAGRVELRVPASCSLLGVIVIWE